VSATLIHLVRHGEVFNPTGVLYGRIPGFGLSELGVRMAAATAHHFAGRQVSALYASPLQRAQESAAPWSELFGQDLRTDERFVEPWNLFEGRSSRFRTIVTKPAEWPKVRNPFRPSWGEPYSEVARRMLAAIDEAWQEQDGGEIVIVSHQLPIVMVQRAVAGVHLWHDPRARRCTLSSVTTLARIADAPAGRPRYREVSYLEPAAALLAEAIDQGAV